MVDIGSFTNLRLRGNFVLVQLELTDEPLVDPMGREAAARTRIIGQDFYIILRSGLSNEELSITLYHEILQASSVAAAQPPATVIDFNEGDFERHARATHVDLGEASPENVNRMLQLLGFREE